MTRTRGIERLETIIISPEATIGEAIEKLDSAGTGAIPPNVYRLLAAAAMQGCEPAGVCAAKLCAGVVFAGCGSCGNIFVF